ncbi:tetratricopeptide (TPR) repeat protein [Streptacidiphilus sp. MAP12-33]|uniref:tetratricopeptide repeat protein n=1 Tax=Streptacidiphilus sp. MAP12-33 TaxID=3156266 RepID=UPI0035166C2D
MTTTPTGAVGDPADPSVRLRKAQTLLGLGRAAEARALCASAVAADPGDTAAWRLLSQCCLDLNEPEEGLSAADQALATEPNDAVALRLRAMGLLRLAERRGTGHDLAVQAAWAAMQAEPDHWYGHALLSSATLPGSGKLWPRDGAQTCYQAALRARELAPHQAGAHFTLGRAADAMHRDAEAEACYRAALALDPEHIAARNNLGRLLLKRGQVKDAAASFAAVAAGDHLLHHETGLGAHNLRAVALRLLSRARWISVVVFIGSVMSIDPAGPSVAIRLTGALLAAAGWAAWALWARQQLPPGLVRPLLRLGRASASLRVALLGVATGTIVGLLLLCVPPLDPAVGVLTLVGVVGQFAALQYASHLGRRERRG